MTRRFRATRTVLSCGLVLAASTHCASPTAASARSPAAEACDALQVPGRIDSETIQTEQSATPFRVVGATLTPLAGFSVDGRVLSREDYYLGRRSMYSPTDLAMGWGPMSAPGLAERLDVTQGGRWYHYHWGNEGPPMPPRQIALNSANMHMVPADAAVAARLAKVRAGERVRVDGWLLQIDGDDGFRWRSSMTREDVGSGACELVLVCAVERH